MQIRIRQGKAEIKLTKHETQQVLAVAGIVDAVAPHHAAVRCDGLQGLLDHLDDETGVVIINERTDES